MTINRKARAETRETAETAEEFYDTLFRCCLCGLFRLCCLKKIISTSPSPTTQFLGRSREMWCIAKETTQG